MYNYFIFKSKFSLNFHLFVSFKEKFDFRCFQKTKSDLITYFPKNKIWSHHIFSKNKIWSYHIFSKKTKSDLITYFPKTKSDLITYFPKTKSDLITYFPKNKHIFQKTNIFQKTKSDLITFLKKNKIWSYHIFSKKTKTDLITYFPQIFTFWRQLSQKACSDISISASTTHNFSPQCCYKATTNKPYIHNSNGIYTGCQKVLL